jgi:acyl transferase domain-containing protein
MVGVPVPKETNAWPRYWREHIRRPVDVLAALRRLGETDCDVFVEIGPNTNLVNLGREHFAGRKAMWLASLQTGSLSERAALVEAVAGLYVAGCPVDFVALHRGRGGAWDDVPLYPFERQRYWLDEAHFSAAASEVAETLNPVK